MITEKGASLQPSFQSNILLGPSTGQTPKCKTRFYFDVSVSKVSYTKEAESTSYVGTFSKS